MMNLKLKIIILKPTLNEEYSRYRLNRFLKVRVVIIIRKNEFLIIMLKTIKHEIWTQKGKIKTFKKFVSWNIKTHLKFWTFLLTFRFFLLLKDFEKTC